MPPFPWTFVVLGPLELRFQSEDLRPGIQLILHLVPVSIRFYGADPLLEAVARAQWFRNIGEGIAPPGDLADSFFKRRGNHGVPIDSSCAQHIEQICLWARGHSPKGGLFHGRRLTPFYQHKQTDGKEDEAWQYRAENRRQAVD